MPVTGFTPGEWSWVSEAANGGSATLAITTTGMYTVNLWMREDGLRIDRLLLTTDTNFIPTGEGPAETAQQTGTSTETTTITRTIVYTYDNLYRLTDADYSTGELYEYEYDAVGNRLKQIIDGDTTDYLYDAANRLEKLDGQAVYDFDDNGNLLSSDTLTNTWDAANRLTEIVNPKSQIQNRYNGVNDRVAQVTDGVTTTFALDVAGGLPEVIATGDNEVFLHLPGVIVAEGSTGETRYLLSDGLGSVRHAVDESAVVVAYNEFDPYGNPVEIGSEPYGYTGEWWVSYIELLHLRTRWYAPGTGTFLSVDPVESEHPYLYIRGNPVNHIDPSGKQGPPGLCPIRISDCDLLPGGFDNLVKPFAVKLSKNPYYQIFEAVETSHRTQDSDGFIFGFAGSVSLIWLNTSAQSVQEIINWDLAFNNTCPPDTGEVRGIEVVFDIKHQERGIFTYEGDV